MKAKSYLLIDNSNTRTKLMRAQGGQLLEGKKIIPTADISADNIKALLRDWDYDACIICSVVPPAQQALRDGLDCPSHLLAWDSPHGICFDNYPDKNKLGADRIANIIALKSRGHKLSLAIDLGTAITYDVLKQEGGQAQFLGGIIAPGFAAISNYLSTQTAQLPSTPWALPASALGQCTREAIQAGIALAFKGMIRESIATLSQELGGKPYTIATGGDAQRAASLLPEIDAVDENLTFIGLLGLLEGLEKRPKESDAY